MRVPMKHQELTSAVIGCALRVHRELGAGFLESVYQNALATELRAGGMLVETELPLDVFYRGHRVGHFLADMLVDGLLIVENKAVQTLAPIHEVQLVNYLSATNLEIGLLFNFGTPSLQIKRKVRTLSPPPPRISVRSDKRPHRSGRASPSK